MDEKSGVPGGGPWRWVGLLPRTRGRLEARGEGFLSAWKGEKRLKALSGFSPLCSS